LEEENLNHIENENEIAKISKDDEVQTIPLDIKILYSLPAFGKMSCLLILR